MKRELHIPIHRAIDKEAIRKRIMHVGVKGLDINQAEELGLISRISNLLCAIYTLTEASYRLYGEVDYLFDKASVRRHEIKKACIDFEKAYDRWFSFWQEYQSPEGTKELNYESEDFVEQFMRWVGLPVSWELGDSQGVVGDREPMIEIDLDDRIWRIYRDVAESESVCDEDSDEWAVFSLERPKDNNTMICVERNMDKASAKMSAMRMSANDPKRLYTANKLEVIKEKRLEVVPYAAYMNGKMIGSIKSIVK